MPQILDYWYSILKVRVFGTGKTNSLFNLISHQQDINKTYLCAKDPYEAKYQFLFNKQEITGLKHLNYPKAFIEYSSDTDDICEKVE